MKGIIIRINGPLVIARGLSAKLYDLVRVGIEGLIGEVIKLDEDLVFIQVYEDTTGLSVGEEVMNTEAPLTVELGPGLLSGIFDGIQRPLQQLEKISGFFIRRGVSAFGLSREKKWHFIPEVKVGDIVEPGDVIGKVEEKKELWHYILLPHDLSGKVARVEEGEFTVEEPVAHIESSNHKPKALVSEANRKTKSSVNEVNIYKLTPITMLQKWPVRLPRPMREKLTPEIPFTTGQRVLDSFFTIAKGGTAIIPGGFGTGKTVLQQTLAKFCNCNIIIYVGCGERGNEMADVLYEFPLLTDPHTQRLLMDRTVLIVNTSNMPVAAREASIYVGITIAEYYRDMGYDVALMADSTSRWAEALREISSRLEEMPAEEGYPPYLPIRLSLFYERAGQVLCLGKNRREGSITIIGAVSPPGGDFSEPVTQSSLRIVGAYWALDTSLAYRRHFPAINWSLSYSLYREQLIPWFTQNVSTDWNDLLLAASGLLQEEDDIQKVAQVVGVDALPEQERITLESCGMMREVFLQQNAFHPIDGYCSLKRQEALLRLILKFYQFSRQFREKNLTLEEILEHPLREEITRLNELSDEEFFLKVTEIEGQLE